MDKTESVIALDNLEAQALPAAEYAVGQYLEALPSTDVAEMTVTQYQRLIEVCVVTWKARYETLFAEEHHKALYEIDDEIPF